MIVASGPPSPRLARRSASVVWRSQLSSTVDVWPLQDPPLDESVTGVRQRPGLGAVGDWTVNDRVLARERRSHLRQRWVFVCSDEELVDAGAQAFGLGRRHELVLL